MKAFSTRDLPLILDRKSNLARESRVHFPGRQSVNRTPHDALRHRAYAIWEREGQPHNRQLANWLEAEAEVKDSL